MLRPQQEGNPARNRSGNYNLGWRKREYPGIAPRRHHAAVQVTIDCLPSDEKFVAKVHTLCQHSRVIFDWDPEKEQWLTENRGLSFQHVIYHIDHGDLLDVRAHPNRDKYPNQRIMIVRMSDYAYVVPYVQNGETLFLKTIIPSRKETKRYLYEEAES